MIVELTPAQNRFLRGQAHGLKAMLQVGGKGITDALVAEVDGALEHHELIKVKVAAADRVDDVEFVPMILTAQEIEENDFYHIAPYFL